MARYAGARQAARPQRAGTTTPRATLELQSRNLGCHRPATVLPPARVLARVLPNQSRSAVPYADCPARARADPIGLRHAWASETTWPERHDRDTTLRCRSGNNAHAFGAK